MPNGKIINIEWFGDVTTKEKTEYLLDEIKKSAHVGYDNIILIMLMDGFLPLVNDVFKDQMQTINQESSKLGIKNILLISGHGEKFSGLENDFFFIDYTLRMTYNAYKHQLQNQGIPDQKFLFLGGVSTRPNRIGLLKRFYEKGLLKNMEWSFFSPSSDSDRQWCRNYCQDYTDQEYQTFLTECERSVDDIYNECKKYFGNYSHTDIKDWCSIVEKDFIKCPGYIDPAIFKKTLFSVISEGINYWPWSVDFEFVTEKFWRTVLMKHAFIFSGYTQQFDYVKKLGFRTFENYLPKQNYAYIIDEEERLDAVVFNSEYLLKNYSLFEKEITADVEYNFNLAIEYISKQNKIFHLLEKEYGVNKEDISFYIDRTGYDHLIRRFPDAII